MEALWKWMQSPEAQRVAKAAENMAWAAFFAKFPYADKSKFYAQTDFADDHQATAEIYFKAGPGYENNVPGSNRKYWPEAMKKALGLGKSGGLKGQCHAIVPSKKNKKLKTANASLEALKYWSSFVAKDYSTGLTP